MTRRPPPQPTTVGAYFFHQLVPGEPAAGPESSHMSSAVASVLRDSFTSADAASLMRSAADAERARTDELEALLSAAWGRVEDVQARNRERRRALDEDLPRAIAAMDALTFWTPETVAGHYSLPPQGRIGSSGSEDSEDCEDCEEPKGPEDPKEPKEPKDPEGREGNLPRRARAFDRSDSDLLDPARQPRCLRRIFAPLLQRRAALPRNLTLLLRAVQRVQTEELPVMEAVVEKGFFGLPLYRPLRHVAMFISRHLSQESCTSTSEVDFSVMYKARVAALNDAFASVRALDGPPSSRGGAAAEVIYNTLLAELRARRELDTQCDGALSAMTCASEAQLSAIEQAVEHCDVESQQSLDHIKHDANVYIERLRSAADRISDTIAEVHAVFAREEARVSAALQARQHAARRSEQEQETLARRVREATKALLREQRRYEALSQEVVADSVTLRQLRLSHAQLSGILETRLLSDGAAKKTEWVTDSMHRAAEVRTELIAQCRAHVERLRTDEKYRRCRIAAYARDNALAWSRCLHDLAELYEGHYDNLSNKIRVSMQLRYLLSNEKDQAVGNLQQLQREMKYLDSRWAGIATALEELDMEVPPLTKQETEEECREMRRIMREQDSRRLIHGKFTRLVPQEERQVESVDLGGMC